MACPKTPYTKLFINNEFVDAKAGKTFKTFDPSTEELICEVQEGDAADIEVAVKAARAAFRRGSVWRTMDASKRGDLLRKLATLVERDMDYITDLEVKDNGKTKASATGDCQFGVKVLNYYAGMADKLCGKTMPMDGNYVAMTRREALGVVGCIIPWNYPFFLAILKLAPTLAAGCTIVMKPAEQTPVSTIYLAYLCKEAGFPAGVVNVVPGYGETAGAALSSHPDVNAISFTGSTEVGQLIMKAAAVNIKRLKLELGGKSPLIVFDDADFEKAAKVAHEAAMVNHGQCCVAGTRTFVQSGIYDKFVARLKELAEGINVGNPFDANTTQGPQIDKIQFDRIMEMIDSGKKQGATLVTGGCRVGDKGFFVKPTVFADVKDEMRIAKEEIFGPVQSVLKFDTFDEVIDRANDTHYGLGAGVFTGSIDTAFRVSQCVEAGSFWINCYNDVAATNPFGGFKMSGVGRELGEHGIESYTEEKTIVVAITEKNS